MALQVFLLILSALPTLPLYGEEETSPAHEVTIPGMWYLPAVDGIWYGSPADCKAEWGWTKVPVLKDFILQKGGEPTQRTEVRLYYSARSLHVAFTCFDADLENLVPGVSPANHPVDAPLEWLEDVVEIFVQPDESSPIYFQLGVNPNGARFDQVRGRGAPSDWNGRWRAATRILEDRWQAEIVVDISSLALPNQFRGTPPRGNSWLMTFCRSAGHWKEYSSWGKAMGWHRPQNWGRVVFGPKLAGPSWKDQPHDPSDAIVTEVDAGEPNLGERALKVELKNPGDKPLDLVLKMAVGDAKGWSLDPVSAKESLKPVQLGPGESREVPLTYLVTEGRGPRKSLVFTVTRKGLSFPSYYADCQFRIFPLRKRVGEMEAELRAMAAQCLQYDPDRKHEDARECLSRIELLKEKLAQAAPSRTAPAQAIPLARAAEKDLEKLRLDFANRIRPRLYLAGHGVERPGFAVGVTSSAIKVFPDTPFKGSLGEPARLFLARNEYESVQTVILPVSTDLKEVRVQITPLSGPGGARFDLQSIRVHRVGTVLIEAALPVRNGLWPDPLYPTERTPVTAFTPQPMMVTVRSAEDQTPGVYRGAIRFSAEGADAIEVPLEVTVYDFALPKALSLFNDIWFCPIRASTYYGEVTPELFAKFAELTSRYHVPASINFTTVQRLLRRVLKPDGSLGFDFSALDPFIDTMRKTGAQRVNTNFGNSWQTWRGFYASGTWYYVPGRRQARLKDGLDPDQEYERHLRAVHSYLLEKGWTREQLFYVGGDEPWAKKVRDEMRPGYEIARRAVPDIKRQSAAAHPGMKELHDLIDIWCPQVREFSPSAYRDDPREVWMYTCGWKYPPYPCYSIMVPGVAARITHWVCRKYGVTAFLYWGMNVWETGNGINVQRTKSHAEKRWVHDRWKPALNTGDGILVYPTPGGPIPSQRLLCIRDGTEDHEYLTILSQLANRQSSADKKLTREARRLAAVPNEIVASTTQWTTDIDKLERARQRVAQLIVELSGKGRRR